jgi:hypothetical protein
MFRFNRVILRDAMLRMAPQDEVLSRSPTASASSRVSNHPSPHPEEHRKAMRLEGWLPMKWKML